MGYQELIESLQRDAEEQAGRIRRDAEAEAARLKAETSVRIARLREEYAFRRSAAEAAQTRAILAEAESRVASIRLMAEKDLADRLYAHAVKGIENFRDGEYARLFAELAGELPECSWRRVVVNPADEALAAELFPAAEIVADPSVAGGLDASNEDGRIRVNNTLAKRLERGWPFILPDILRDVCRER